MMVVVDRQDTTLLMHTVQGRSADIFTAILRMLPDYLPTEQVQAYAVASDLDGAPYENICCPGTEIVFFSLLFIEWFSFVSSRGRRSYDHGWIHGESVNVRQSTNP